MRRAAPLAVALVVAFGGSGCGGESGAPPSDAPPDTPASDTPACDDPPCYTGADTIGTLQPDVVEQVSGMAASRRSPGLYYVVSDVAGTSEVAAVHEDGSLVARVEIEDMDARNAEALAVGACGAGTGSGSCLYVGDIGDHVGRDDVVVHRVPEPDLPAEGAGPAASDVLRYTYPDAPTDAEALMVDGDGRPLIVSKASFDRDTGNTGPTRLYRGPRDGGVLELIGEVDLPQPEDPVFAGLVGNVVTGASASDGRVLLRTYDEVLEYRAGAPAEGSADVADFPSWPLRRVPSPAQVQPESVTYRVDGCGYLTTAELTGTIDAVGCAR